MTDLLRQELFTLRGRFVNEINLHKQNEGSSLLLADTLLQIVAEQLELKSDAPPDTSGPKAAPGKTRTSLRGTRSKAKRRVRS